MRERTSLWPFTIFFWLWLLAGVAPFAVVAETTVTVPADGPHRGYTRHESASAAVSEARHALVIGNSAYKSAPLANPVNDAEDIAGALGELGFKVTHLLDASKSQMEQAIVQFGRDLKNGGGVGMFYYAGHGMQVGGANYLIPVGANVAEEHHVRFEAVDVGRVLAEMEFAGNRLNLVVLDACRDNPFKRSFRSSAQGLAQMDAPRGTLIAYATAPGHTAADGRGRNGIYTGELLKQLRRPELPVEQVFKQVRAGVLAATNEVQTPWESSSLVGDFYFVVGGSIHIHAAQPSESSRADGGSLEIDSRPPGAIIYINGGRAGTAPLTVDLPIGVVTVRGESDGHEAHEEKLFIRRGVNDALVLLLNPKAGRITIGSEPSGAIWYLDTARVGQTPGERANLSPGRYSVKVEKEGYMPWSNTVDLASGQSVELLATLQRIGSGKRAGEVIQDRLGDGSEGPEMIVVPAGCFDMGSDTGGAYEKPPHEVCIAEDFALGKYEVSQDLWRKIMGANPPGSGSNPCRTDDCPVLNVSWFDVRMFISKLNERAPGKYRLPSEAEWEYACRSGGKKETYCGGEDPGTRVNGLGLYDMTGGLSELTLDCVNNSYVGAPNDGRAWETGDCSRRVVRGGSSESYFMRSTARGSKTTFNRHSDQGFRLVRTF